MEWVRQKVRRVMRLIAKLLNQISGGRISPNMVTMVSLLAHIPIAYLIARGYFGYAAIGIIIFGLLDTLDGELARLQNKVSSTGMLLDASTDRMKEVLLYIGAAYVLISSGKSYMAVWAVAACGGSLLVSYIKAKGETAVAGEKLSANEVNRLFQDGLMRYEIRMTVLVLGLLFNLLGPALIVITITSWLTSFGRLTKISRKLRDV
jgi:CDP-diacylglycerol---glycerol-3-phosphate 3-phosphatidyltransferase